MKQILLLIVLSISLVFGQQSYFPPLNSESWDSLPASQLGWPQDRIDSLYRFLDNSNSKSFLVLKDGKRVLEQYFDSFQRDSFWYWASAGKCAAAFLMGMAQDEGLLHIQDKTSDYLGKGWTSATASQEDSITIWHQITMTTGLDDGLPITPQVPDPLNCLDPSCLQYLTSPGTRWAYHNAPYRLVQDVIAQASGQTINQFTRSRLFNRTGMRGLWFDYVLLGRARDMARFGLLVLENGVWDTDTLIRDQAYMQAMIRPSQNMNEAYGYLWWLNGQASYLPPRVQLRIPGQLVSSAPSDMVAALGKNDQKVYVVPSLNMVVVRQGNAADLPALGPSSFDTELWEILSWLGAPTTSVEAKAESEILIYPNPASDMLFIKTDQNIKRAELIGVNGQRISLLVHNNQCSLEGITNGVYMVELESEHGILRKKLLVQ
ncbi:MAG: serine hydrolase [Bacteroidia bacterium]